MLRSSTTLALVLAAMLASANAAATWNIVAKDLFTTDLGVSFVNATTGYTAGDANGSGPAILKSTDGGHTWNQCEANFGIDMLLLALAACEQSVVVSSIFGELYSDDDGASFHISVGGGLSQSARYVGKNGDGGHTFGVAGMYGGKNGVAISTDSGKLFKAYTSASIASPARYAAYPSDTTWYLAAGQWPNNSASTDASDSTVVRPRTSAFQLPNGRFPASFESTGNTVGDGYIGEIYKTTDGGSTWKNLFSNSGSFYFNEIDCNPSNPNHCCAVGESPDGPNPGARIYCTFDGENFNRTYFAPATQKTHYSLMNIRFASENLIWASGSNLNAIAPSAWFLQSTDGGKTWDAQSHTIFGYAALALDVVSEKIAYAAVDNLVTQSSGIAKYISL